MLNEKLLKELVALREETGEKSFELEGTEYKVLNEYEIFEEMLEHQEILFENLGLDSFSPWAKEYILDNCIDRKWFETFEYEVLYEEASYIDDEEWNEILAEWGLEECSINDYVKNMMSSDSVAWFIDWAGQAEFEDRVLNEGLIDFKKVTNFVIDMDGYECLAYYGYVEEMDQYFIIY